MQLCMFKDIKGCISDYKGIQYIKIYSIYNYMSDNTTKFEQIFETATRITIHVVLSDKKEFLKKCFLGNDSDK